MGNKKYSSYAEIENDLEILKIEKEIHYQKLVLSIQKTKESITPQNLVNGFVSSYVDSAKLSFEKIIPGVMPFVVKTAIPLLIQWLLKKKRGN